VAAQRGHPVVLRCDNRPELACVATADWAAAERVGLAFIPPSEPWRNGYIESLTSASAANASNIIIISATFLTCGR
jgi:putative transposase